MGDKLKYLRDHFFDSPKKKVMAIITGLTIVGVGIGTSIMYKPVQIQIGETILETSTMMGTVQDVLDKNNIILDQKDKIVPSLESKLSKNSIINITKAQEVIIFVDGKELSIKSAEDTIEDMLLAEQITLDEDDRVDPHAQTKIEKGQKVEIVRIDEELITENENIDFEVTVKQNKELDKSVKKTVQEGQTGQKEITLKVIYENGQEVQRDIISEKITKEPITKIIEEGTRESYVSISRGAEAEKTTAVTTNQTKAQSTSGKTITMESTAYYTGNITATGTAPKRNPNGLSTVAVDPRVIPLGSKVYIDGYGYAIAEDTGGAIKNNIIDVFLNSKEECINWGRRNVQVTIVAYPGQW